MRKLLLSTIAALAIAAPAYAAETDAAIDATIAAAIAAPIVVREAFTIDVCSAENLSDLVDHTEARDALPIALRPAYDAIGDLLAVVYRTVEPTDGELEAVTRDFCDGLTEQD